MALNTAPLSQKQSVLIFLLKALVTFPCSAAAPVTVLQLNVLLLLTRFTMDQTLLRTYILIYVTAITSTFLLVCFVLVPISVVLCLY
jgi:hypothetical protein